MNEMSKTIAKLTSFKKNVLQSFGEEDLEEYKNSYILKNRVRDLNLYHYI